MRFTPPGLTSMLCSLPLALSAGLGHAQTGAAPAAPAYGFGSGNGKLLLTGGVSSIDGAAGGGLTPWAVTGSYATTGQFGATAFLTRISTRDYGLTDVGVAFSHGDRVEVSLAHQDFSTGPVAAALAGLLGDPSFNGLHLKQYILGVKLRVAGDAVLDSDTLMPQIAVGLQYKQSHTGPLAPVLEAFGAKKNGTDFYVSATKLFLAQGILVNGTLRATQANQNGLLGFGATGHDRYSVKPEVSVAYLLSKRFAIGAEYRFKPDNFRDNTAIAPGALAEGDWKDVFVAWAPSKNASVTLAFVDLGKIVPGVANRRQTGGYLSAQLAF